MCRQPARCSRENGTHRAIAITEIKELERAFTWTRISSLSLQVPPPNPLGNHLQLFANQGAVHAPSQQPLGPFEFVGWKPGSQGLYLQTRPSSQRGVITCRIVPTCKQVDV